MKIQVAYDDRLLKWKGSIASPVRAKNALDLLVKGGADLDVQAIQASPVSNLLEVHDARYVSGVLSGKTGSMGADVEQGEVAKVMFDGTVQLTHQLLAAVPRQPWVGFSPQGAKHHAMWNHASGFCTFNDFAWAARTLSANGLRVLYLDWDAHHGDGVEALTFHDDQIMTASIHEWGIFPGTGGCDHPDRNVWNWALDAESGDGQLLEAVVEVFDVAADQKFVPDVVLIASGADGHGRDQLSSLQYTIDGYRTATEIVARRASALGVTRVLVGGAGGYRPHDTTPLVWATVVSTLANELERLHENDVHDDAEVIQ